MDVYNPISTYRLQLHKKFTLEDVENVLAYLQKFGIKTLYASPVFQAVKGSTHGYDITDPNSINREIGSWNAFEQLMVKIHRKGMGWIQDIVPNHMAYSTQNPWISDVLQNGRSSRYFKYFDIFSDHHEEALREKIMLPFFGRPLDEVIEDGEISVQFRKTGFYFRYFGDDYPLSPGSWSTLLTAIPEKTHSDKIHSYPGLV